MFAAPALAQTNDPARATTTEIKASAAITFPIAALGNCSSKEACKLYCDQTSNREACFTYAAKVGLMTLEKIKAAKILIAKKGPGNCDSKDSCRTYCEDSAHTNECLTFAEEHKIIPTERASLIRKFIVGEGPGACKSSETCRMYCEDSSHRDECRAFAEQNGLARKMASTTGAARARMSSTSIEVKRIIASTTPGRDRGMELRAIHSSTTPPGIDKKLSSTTQVKPRISSTTPPGEFRKPFPSKPAPTTTNDNLGAVILKGFAKMLGF